MTRLAFTPRSTDTRYREAGARVGDTLAHVTAWADGRIEFDARTQDATGARVRVVYYPAGHPRGNRDPRRALVMFEEASGALDIEEPA